MSSTTDNTPAPPAKLVVSEEREIEMRDKRLLMAVQRLNDCQNTLLTSIMSIRGQGSNGLRASGALGLRDTADQIVRLAADIDGLAADPVPGSTRAIAEKQVNTR